MLNAGLYSALENTLLAARGAPRAAEPPLWHQWLDGAQRRGEFRGAERDWLGVDAWLDRQPGKVTREALQAFVQGNRLNLQVVVKGTVTPGDVDLPAGWTVGQGPDGLWRVHTDHQGIAGVGVNAASALRAVPGSTRGDVFAGDPLYGDYVLPGGEGYREVLVRLQRPGAAAEVQVSHLVMGEHRDEWEAMQRLRQQAFGTPAYAAVLEEEARLYARMRDQTLVDQGGAHALFGRSHFDESNVLVHLRLTRRRDTAGQRVLFIEEMQSDWHQAGRSFGYRPPTLFKVLSGVDGRHLAGPFASRDQAEVAAAAQREAGESAWVDPPTSHRPPMDMRVADAPFKPTADWIALAFKQALRTAVQDDDAVIAWTTGAMQTARYDLTDKLSSIHWRQREDGRFDLSAARVGSEGRIVRCGLSPPEMAALAGKEVAARIETAAAACPHPWERQGVLEQDDLRLAGGGMHAFYDVLVPEAVGHYVKSMQGAVAPVALPLPDGTVATVSGVTVTPAMRAAVTGGQPMFRRTSPAVGPVESTGMTVADVATAVREYLAGYLGLGALAVRIGQTLEDLYGPGATEILGSTVAGAYHPARGLLAVAADRMRDRACVEATIRHELFGHFGLNTFQPEDKRAILDAILASRDAPGMSAIWDTIDKRYIDRDLDTRAEEVFALIAEQPRGPGAQLWDQLLAMINQALRAVGLTRGRTSKAELQVLAQSIAHGLREGHRRQQTFPATDDAQFRRTDVPPVGFLMARDQSERLRCLNPDAGRLAPDAPTNAP